MILDQLFKLMSEKSASDIYVSAGTPIHIKINGTAMPINKVIMDPPTIKRMAYEVLSEEQQRSFEETLEMNLSVSRRDVGNCPSTLWVPTQTVTRYIKERRGQCLWEYGFYLFELLPNGQTLGQSLDQRYAQRPNVPSL